MSLLRGSDFKDVKLFKVLNNNTKPHECSYKEGHNVLERLSAMERKFLSQEDIEYGGFHVTDRPECWIRFETLIAPVTLPDDALVWLTSDLRNVRVSQEWMSSDPYRIRVDKFFLGKWSEISDEMYIKAVQESGLPLKDIPERRRTLPICLAAMKYHGPDLVDVPANLQTDEMLFAAVQQNGLVLQDIPADRRTELLCLEALKQSPWNIRYVPPNQCSEAIGLKAVERDGRLIFYIPENLRTEAICRAAMKSYKGAIMGVPNDLRHLFL